MDIPESIADRVVPPLLIYVNAFFLGGVLMGFEMLGSRYLFPYFGGGIGTWAGLISTVLVALTIGYLVGGAIVDRYPSPRVIAVSIDIRSNPRYRLTKDHANKGSPLLDKC